MVDMACDFFPLEGWGQMRHLLYTSKYNKKLSVKLYSYIGSHVMCVLLKVEWYKNYLYYRAETKSPNLTQILRHYTKTDRTIII